MKTLILSVLLLTNTWAMASRLEIIGEGVVVQPAEFLRLDVNITTSCHTSARESRQEADSTAVDLQDLLKKYVDGTIGEQTQASPGNNQQSIKTKYVKDDKGENQVVVICDKDHSWESSSKISFKLTNLGALAQLQDEVLTFIDLKNRTIDSNKSGLAITLSAPEPGVLANTWIAMKNSALKIAHSQALGEARVIMELQQPDAKITLEKMSEAKNSSGGLIYDVVTGQADSNGDSFGRVVLRLSRLFVFAVE